MSTYARLPVSFLRGKGAYLTASDGKEYLDALSGIAVCGLGHAHPKVAEAIADQAKKLVHTSNLYEIPHQTTLGDRLCALSGMDKVFFSNSGAEANEAAIKLARLHGKQQGIKNPAVIVMQGSFHGRTLATLSATGNKKIQAGFEPLVEGFVRVPYNDIAAIEQLASTQDNIAAILVEPIQGEGGVVIPAADYLSNIRQLCNKHNWLMMLDEIQTGMGRTGQWFAFQHSHTSDSLTPNDKPDVMTLAKALGNGVPVGACLASGKAAELFTPGTHGSTFGGNPLATRAALAVLDTMEYDNLVANAENLGRYMLEQFNIQLDGVETVKEIRGKGLMLGIELVADDSKNYADLVKQALDEQLLINVTADNVVRLLPPLIINKEQADTIINSVSILIKTFY
jgi:acetylornithine aminotransferase